MQIWSFGVVFWEILFCERPYKNLESQTIIMGVGKNRLTLPVPASCPVKFKNLMQMCWYRESEKRPDFNQILIDLKIANKEFQNSFTNEKFIEIKHGWKEEIAENFSTMKKFWSSSEDDENAMYDHKKMEELEHVEDMKIKLEEKLQSVNDLLKKLEQREKYLTKKEQELGIEFDYRSSNSLVNSLGRRLLNNMSKNKSSSLKLSRFVRNRSRRSYRLHYAQKQFNNKSSTNCTSSLTKDAEIQTNFFDFDDAPLSLNNDSNKDSNLNHQYKASDSGYGGESTASCLSTPIVKHKQLIATNFYNSYLANSSSSNNQSDNFQDSTLPSNNDKKHSNSFRLHNNTNLPQLAKTNNSNLNCIQEINGELPSGYLEASFENSLMLKKETNKFFEYRTKYSNLDSDTEVSNDEDESEKVHFSSSDEITQELSVDSLNNNKYSEIYRPSSDSLSSSNSLNWEMNNQNESSLKPVCILKSKFLILIVIYCFFFEFQSITSCKRIAATINDENKSDESITIDNSYLVIQKSHLESKTVAETDKTNQISTNQSDYIVLKTPTKDQLSKKNVRDSLLLYKSRGLKKIEQLFI